MSVHPGSVPRGLEGGLMGVVARPPNDRVVRALVPLRCLLLLQQPSEPMQVGREDRDAHGAFEASRPRMRPNGIRLVNFAIRLRNRPSFLYGIPVSC